MNEISKAELYIIPTPIGNLGDITLRALEILKSVQIIACEDTRVTRKLLNAYNISTKLICYNDFSSDRERERIISMVSSGQSVALVSDAGTPLISDPGYKLVKDAVDAGINVSCLPGPSSVITALVLSCMPTNRFLFEGFLPAKHSARLKSLQELKPFNTTLIFFESAKRLKSTLTDMLEIFGNRDVSVLREITKKFEEVVRMNLEEAVNYYQAAPKGEIIIIVAPPKLEDAAMSEHDLENMLRTYLQNMDLKSAVSELAQITGIRKKDIYEKALQITGKK